MAAILRRLPSFRRSSSQQSRNGVDEAGPVQAEPRSAWSLEDTKRYIQDVEADELRRIVTELSETHDSLREALQKHAQEQPNRPSLPHSSHSMNKKRRAEHDLDRALGGSDASPSTVKIANELDQAETDELLPHAPVSNDESGGKVIIEGQTGLVILPAEELNEAGEGSVDGDSESATGAEPHHAQGTANIIEEGKPTEAKVEAQGTCEISSNQSKIRALH